MAAAVIVILECTVFNIGFWSTLRSSTDSSSALNKVGSGLQRRANGSYTVTDPTAAFFQISADGSSSYLRIDAVDPRKAQATSGQSKMLQQVHVRIDSGGNVGRSQSVFVNDDSSLYLKAQASRQMRVWVQEPQGSFIPLYAVRANVQVPFRFNVIRVAALCFIVALVAAWQPRSRLWTIGLNTASKRQRAALAGLLGTVCIMTIFSVFQSVQSTGATTFHEANNYTYDFNQYAHVADALLHGHTWLDLPVPKELAAASNPYSIAARNKLLSEGVTPIYWDYAFYDGHWYSYFGVLPAVLLFMPYQAVSSLWTPSGAMLPSSAAVAVFMFGFLVFGSLFIVRLIGRISNNVSLAATSLTIVLFIIGSNAGYLWFRANFYSTPYAASLMFSCAGLWFWLGAQRRGGTDTHDPQQLSIPHLVAGSLCIAANFGCRPTFTLVALLGIPLFWQQINLMLVQIRRWITHGRAALPPARAQLFGPAAAIILPAIAVVAPLMWYNIDRFGSPFDFGNQYQLTVTDMTTYREPFSNVIRMIGYYLFLPLRPIGAFPFLAISPMPLPQWGYTEAMVAGFFFLCPLAIVSAAIPWLQHRISEFRCWPLLCTCLGLALFLVVIESAIAGLGWRYIIDFGWLFVLASLPGLLALLGEAHADNNTNAKPDQKGSSPTWITLTTRSIVVLLMFVTLAITVSSVFVPGREDPLIRNNPTIFYDVRSWFTAFGIS